MTENFPTKDFLQAYNKCSDIMQKHVDKLVKIIFDEKQDPDDRHQAYFMMDEILFPRPLTDLSNFEEIPDVLKSLTQEQLKKIKHFTEDEIDKVIQ